MKNTAHGLFSVLILLMAYPSSAQSNCPLLDQYMAPFNLPVDSWSVNIAGPAPGDVEQRLVGPEECQIVSEKKISNAYGTPYRQVTIAISGSVFGYAPVNSLVLPPLGTGAQGEGQEHFFFRSCANLAGQGHHGAIHPRSCKLSIYPFNTCQRRDINT